MVQLDNELLLTPPICLEQPGVLGLGLGLGVELGLGLGLGVELGLEFENQNAGGGEMNIIMICFHTVVLLLYLIS